MRSEIKVGQRFKVNILSENPPQEQTAVVTRVLSNGEEALAPYVDFYFADWVEAHELQETEVRQRWCFSVEITTYTCTYVRLASPCGSDLQLVKHR